MSWELVYTKQAQKDALKPYPQALLFALYEASLSARRYGDAAPWARRISPPATGLWFCFTAQALAKDSAAAKATLAELAQLIPQDEPTLRACRDMLRRLEAMKARPEPAETAK